MTITVLTHLLVDGFTVCGTEPRADGTNAVSTPALANCEACKPDCLDHRDADECRGIVQYRMPLSGTGKSFPRCDRAWDARLKTQERLRQDYPDSSTPPSWFDPTNAGETWDDDY